MKRTCGGCRALGDIEKGFPCELGFSNAKVLRGDGYIADVIPSAPCPKPRTNKRLYEIRSELLKK